MQSSLVVVEEIKGESISRSNGSGSASKQTSIDQPQELDYFIDENSHSYGILREAILMYNGYD